MMKNVFKQNKGWLVGVIFGSLVVLSFAISACDSGGSGGGGGGGGGNPPPAVNRAPEITSTPVITATVGELYGYTVEATDLDGDSLEFGFVDVFPPAMTLDTKSGLISWLPDVADVGDHAIKVSVSDGTTADYQEFIVTVSLPINHAPVFTSIPRVTAFAEKFYYHDVDATDVDGDTLDYLLEVFPADMNIDEASGVITWTPSLGQVGDHTVKVKVSDGTTAAYQEFTVTVSLPPNHAPVFFSTPGTTATSGQIYNYQLIGWDVDHDPLTYFLAISPVNMIINELTGLISLVPRVGQAGDYQVKVGVTDGESITYQEYLLTVSLPAGTDLIFISEPRTLTFVGEAYTYQAQAFDAAGHALTFGIGYGPPGLNIDPSSGQVSWIPVAGAVGNNWIELTVTDGTTTASQRFAIRVSPTDNGIPYKRGCVFTTWWYEDLYGIKGESALLTMHEDGCDTVLIVITGYQSSISSTTIYTSAIKTPTDDGITHVTNFAHSLGMAVYFKVHVDIPSGTWRGYITFPTDAEWTAWFVSYDALMAHYLDLAEALGVDGFIIGTELKGTEHRESQWRNTIALGRSKFSGLMSYDANWDSYVTINWWDALDFIGISAYFPLTASYTPTVPQLVAGWDPWKTELSALALVWNMDIVFLELGYQSRNGTNISPNWAPSGVQDLEEQSDCYEAAFEALFHEPWFKGMSWWMWYWDPIQDINGFDVYNKPAEEDLRWWFAGN